MSSAYCLILVGIEDPRQNRKKVADLLREERSGNRASQDEWLSARMDFEPLSFLFGPPLFDEPRVFLGLEVKVTDFDTTTIQIQEIVQKIAEVEALAAKFGIEGKVGAHFMEGYG